MYSKGKSFLAAALLLRKRGGYEFVVLHLICQSVEITLKGLLLFKDYDHYHNELKVRFGHNLRKLATEVSKAFGIEPIPKDLASELEALNALYRKHLLRYGTFYDILIDPRTIATSLTSRKIAAVIRLADRYIHASRTP